MPVPTSSKKLRRPNRARSVPPKKSVTFLLALRQGTFHRILKFTRGGTLIGRRKEIENDVNILFDWRALVPSVTDRKLDHYARSTSDLLPSRKPHSMDRNRRDPARLRCVKWYAALTWFFRSFHCSSLTPLPFSRTRHVPIAANSYPRSILEAFFIPGDSSFAKGTSQSSCLPRGTFARGVGGKFFFSFIGNSGELFRISISRHEEIVTSRKVSIFSLWRGISSGKLELNIGFLGKLCRCFEGYFYIFRQLLITEVNGKLAEIWIRIAPEVFIILQNNEAIKLWYNFYIKVPKVTELFPSTQFYRQLDKFWINSNWYE